MAREEQIINAGVEMAGRMIESAATEGTSEQRVNQLRVLEAACIEVLCTMIANNMFSMNRPFEKCAGPLWRNLERESKRTYQLMKKWHRNTAYYA